MLSSNLSWHFFARGNRVYKTRFIYRVLESQFLCDVSIHVEITDLWVPPGNRFSETRFLIGFFQKIKVMLTPLTLAQSWDTLCHSLSLSRLPSPLSVTLPLTPPSQRLHHTLSRWVAPRHPHTSHAHFSLTLTALSLTFSIVSQSGGVKHRLHPLVNSIRYDFVIVWFFHVGLWFLFQSYGFRVLLCLIWLYFYFTKKNVWPWCYHTIIIIIPSLYIWIWSNFL